MSWYTRYAWLRELVELNLPSVSFQFLRGQCFSLNQNCHAKKGNHCFHVSHNANVFLGMHCSGSPII